MWAVTARRPPSLLFFLSLFLFPLLPPRLAANDNPEWKNEVVHFTSRDGLPTSSIFKVLEDDRGYIWLASNHGAVRYDGYNFRSFTTKEGLTDNTVLNIFKDAQNRIWFCTLNRELCYFLNDRILPFTTGTAGDSLLKNFPTTGIWGDPDGTLWIAGAKKLFAVRDNRITPVDWRADPRRGGGNYVLYRAGSRWAGLHGIRGGPAAVAGLLYRDSTFCSLNLPLRPDAAFSTTGMVRGRCVIAGGSSLVQFDTAGRLVVQKSPGGEIINVETDRNGHLWVLTERGAFRYRSGDISASPPEQFLPRKIITSVLLDRAGNYWFSDRDNGLFLLPGIGFRTLRPNPDPQENSYTSLKVYDGALWFGDTRGSVYRLEGDERPRRVVNGWDVLPNYAESLDFLVDEGKSVWTGQQLKRVTRAGRITPLPAGSVKTLRSLRDGSVAVGTWSGFRILRGEKIVFNSLDAGFTERTDALYEDPEGRLWVGTVSGLYSYDGRTITGYGEKNPLLRNRIVAIDRCPDGTLVLGTRGYGGLLVRGERVERIDVEHGLGSDVVRSVYAENDSTLWMGTNRGLNRLYLRKGTDGRYPILTGTTAEGLPSNGINSIIKHDGYLWLATDDGICRFHPDSVGPNTTPLPVEITGVRVNNRPVPLQESYVLPYDRNSISVGFVGIGFRTLGEITYHYRLLGYGEDSLWQETTDRNEQYLELPPGDYTFQVTVVNEHGIWNPVPAEIRIRIVPHITQRLWFRGGGALLLLGLIGAAAYRLFENQRKRHRIDAQIRELRQKILNANMSPHFIFNALSSIQDYINQHSLYEANKFLAQFSKLIRLNMEISQKSFVPLQEELERLQLYLSLEKLRFGNRLDYRIDVDGGIDTDDVPIPTLLIQPYVENAIWHGILPAEREGLVEIGVALQDARTYRITIRDNGVGLGFQGGRSPSNHTSMSMRLNRERLELLGRSLHRTFGIDVANRHAPSGEVAGVIVTITLPLDIPDDATGK